MNIPKPLHMHGRNSPSGRMGSAGGPRRTVKLDALRALVHDDDRARFFVTLPSSPASLTFRLPQLNCCWSPSRFSRSPPGPASSRPDPASPRLISDVPSHSPQVRFSRCISYTPTRRSGSPCRSTRARFQTSTPRRIMQSMWTLWPYASTSHRVQRYMLVGWRGMGSAGESWEISRVAMRGEVGGVSLPGIARWATHTPMTHCMLIRCRSWYRHFRRFRIPLRRHCRLPRRPLQCPLNPCHPSPRPGDIQTRPPHPCRSRPLTSSGVRRYTVISVNAASPRRTRSPRKKPGLP